MEPPNKIHIGSCDPSLERGIATASVEKMKSDDIEYIRKDTLLEWANNALSSRRNMGDDYFIPAIVVLNELIDKLNSI